MQRLIANAALRYASRDLTAGEEFEASDKDAFVLTNTGKAKAKAKPEAKPETKPEAVEDAQPPAKRRYNRRDMRAEE